MRDELKRRDFLKTTATAGVGLSLGASSMTGRAVPLTTPAAPVVTLPLEKVRVGFVGVGHQGSSHVRNYLKIPNVEIKAICDLLP